jgi:hypothetical protein
MTAGWTEVAGRFFARAGGVEAQVWFVPSTSRWAWAVGDGKTGLTFVDGYEQTAADAMAAADGAIKTLP